MTGVYIGLIMFCIGTIITSILNRNVKVPISNDFWDMPIRIKIGILLVIVGILLICISIMYVLISNPLSLLK